MRKKIPRYLLIGLGCILLNLGGRALADIAKLPIWLDMVGTCLAAIYMGCVGSVVVAAANNIIWGFVQPTAFVYTIVSILIANMAYLLYKKGHMETPKKVLISGFWIAFISLIVSTPLNLYFNQGYSGNMWGDALFDMLSWQEMPHWFCSFAGEAIVESVDKQVVVLVAFAIYKLIEKRQKNPKEVKTVITSVLLIGTLVLGCFTPLMTYAEKEEQTESVYEETQELTEESSSQLQADDELISRSAFQKNVSMGNAYVSQVYNNSNGMMSSEANVIEETDDGIIWIGSYAGLTRYDGNKFEFINKRGLTNVTSLLNDSKGRLWIGTNDNGVVCYENNTYTFFTVEDGLPCNSIRCFAEADDGSIYIGTTDKICKIDKKDKISVLDCENVYVISLLSYQNILFGVDNRGILFAYDSKTGKELEIAGNGNQAFFNCIKKLKNEILAGCSGEDIYEVRLDGNEISLRKKYTVTIKDVMDIREDSTGKIWLVAENGMGFLTTEKEFVEKKYEDFDTSFESVFEDYQENIWVASSRYGVLKLSKCMFLNLFSQSGIEPRVVNAVIFHDRDLYCGTDTGLVILSGTNGKQVENELSTYLGNSRIRCMIKDSEERVWVCTYSDKGLVCMDKDGTITSYTKENSGLTTNRIRCIKELKDKTLAVGTADGLNFLRDGAVVSTITAEDGLKNSQILCIEEDASGNVYVGSDGAGIYVISNYKIKENLTTKDGLSADVVLRMTPYNDGFFVVASNALCYMKDGKIRELTSFPYYNNYDVKIYENYAYVFSSNGIYAVNAKEIANDSLFEYRLYTRKDGVTSGLVANSWNIIDEYGIIYFCGNSGVTQFYKGSTIQKGNFRCGVDYVMCDGQRISEENGVFHIPPATRELEVKSFICNYSLASNKARFFIEGVGITPKAVAMSDINVISISKLPKGRYNLHLQIFDEKGERILQEKVFVLEKDPQVWENTWYKIYLWFVILETVVLVVWNIGLIFQSRERKRELEKVSHELEEKVDLQTKVIQLQQEETKELLVQTVMALSDAVDAKDRYTSGHSKRVANYAKMIAQKMNKSEEEQEKVYRAGLLHDVGKIRVPEAVINKTGKLTDDEFELIKVHPVTGYHILKKIPGEPEMALAAKFHHEKYDGTGYPSGLKGENIPEVARIIGVADSYDAMASNRSYRKALPQEIVRSEIEKGKRTQFDPDIADIMLELIDADKEYSMKQTEELEQNILVVDDEPINIKMVEFIMKDEPLYKILKASSGEEALEIVKNQKLDLVLLDVKMPNMDGFETLVHIREMSNVPVVFITADKESDTIQKASEYGVDDYLTKPFLPMSLKEVFHSMLNG